MPEIKSNPFLSALARSGLLDSEQFSTIAAVVDSSLEPRLIAGQLVRDQVLTAWQAKFLLSGRDNLIVGKYVLLERLSQDGLGDKFLAVHPQLERRVDLQILPAELSSQADSLQRFLGETTAAAKLDSPALVHVYDVDQHQGRYYVVSEHFEARPLQEILTAGESWDLSKLATVARQWIEGLSYALGNGVLHRDVTPRSLQVAEDGTAKLGDITLGSLSRRLGQSDADVVVASTAEDDVVRLGTALMEFIDRCGGLADPHARQRLRAIFDQLTRVRDWEVELPRIQANLDHWITRQHRSLTQSTESAEAGSKGPRQKTGGPADHGQLAGMFVEQRPWLWIVAGSTAVCAILAVLVWFSFGARGAKPISEIPGRVPPQMRPVAPGAGAAAKTANSAAKASASPLDSAVDKHQAAADAAPPEIASEPKTAVASAPPDQPPAEANESQAAPQDKIAPSAAVPEGGLPAHKSESSPMLEASPPSPSPSATPPPAAEAATPMQPQMVPAAEKMVPITEVLRAETNANALPPSPDGDAAQPPPGSSGPQAPFAALPSAVELPTDLNADAETIGLVHTGEHYLLGVNLHYERELTRKTDFTLVRAPGDQSQRWTVTAESRSNREPVELAQIWLEDSRLQFRWLPGAADIPNSGYLRNCVLKLECQNDFRYLRLRTPLQLPALRVSAEQAQAKCEFDLPFAPDRELLSVVVQAIGGDPTTNQDQFLFVFEPLDQSIPERGVCSVYLTQKSDRFFRLDLEAKLAKKSTVTARFLINANPFNAPDRVYSPKWYAELDTLMSEHAQQLSAHAVGMKEYFEKNRDTKEFEGKITKAEEAIREKQKELDAANQLVNLLHEQHAATAHLFDQPIQLRIYFNLAEQQVELARFAAIPAPPAEGTTDQ